MLLPTSLPQQLEKGAEIFFIAPLIGSVEQGAQSDGSGCRCVPMVSAGPLPLHPLPPTHTKSRTSTEVPEDVIALLREGDLVDGVSDVASLQQIAGIFAGLTAVCEALHVVIEPIYHIRTCHQIRS